jgi:tetratricopeptide (TPR) repeat protein
MERLIVVTLALLVSACTTYQPPKVKDNAAYYYNQGVARYEKGDYAKAINDYTKAIEWNPRYAEAYYNRGIAYDDKGQYDRAIKDYTEAIEINPRYSDAYVNRGIAYGRKGEYDQAVLDFNEAIGIDPNGANAYYNRGLAYNKKGHYSRAISDYTKAIEIKSGYSSAYNSLAWILATCVDGRYRDGREAIKLSKQALKSNSNPIYMDTLAAAYAEAGKFEDAVQTQKEVLTLLREKGDAYNLMGEASRRLEFYRAGKAWREK